MISKFSSERVEGFAGYCVKLLCSEIGFRDLNDNQLALIVRNCSDLAFIMGVLKAHYPVQHHGEYGELDKALQNKLNFELALCEICGKSSNEKRKLIEEAIREHDNYIEKSKKWKEAEEFMTEVGANIEHVSHKLNFFLGKITNLYSIQKNELRRLIQNDSEYEVAIISLSGIYRKHWRRAIDISRQ